MPCLPRRPERADQFELDVLGRQVVEQPSLPEVFEAAVVRFGRAVAGAGSVVGEQCGEPTERASIVSSGSRRVRLCSSSRHRNGRNSR